MDLSLDEIIQKKRIGYKPVKKGFPVAKKPANFSSTSGPTKRRVIDARNKIIQKNRSKIRDAREKLAQITRASGDARLKLMKKKRLVPPKPMGNNFRNKKMLSSKPRPKFPAKMPLVGVPRGYIDYDNMELEEEQFAEYQSTPMMSLRRTVHNDILPPFRYKPSDRPSKPWGNGDPFDCYEIPITRPSDGAEPVNIRREVRNMSPDILPRKGILRSSRQLSPYSRRYLPEQSSHLSYEMRTRLEHAPDPHASMGIFANPLVKQSQQPYKNGYRIVVSNLHGSVTQSDIKELFEDIGELVEARLVRPGIAEVIFANLKDAEKAVDTYHNRQLDGQPMKCLLVNPRSSNKPTAPAIKSSNSISRSSNKTPLEIDIDALHKVLFRRH